MRTDVKNKRAARQWIYSYWASPYAILSAIALATRGKMKRQTFILCGSSVRVR
jgi:hypothetical protein